MKRKCRRLPWPLDELLLLFFLVIKQLLGWTERNFSDSNCFLLAGLHKVKVEGKESNLRAQCSNPQHLEHKGGGLVTCFVFAGRVTSLAHHDNPESKKIILWCYGNGEAGNCTINNTLRGRGFPGKKNGKRCVRRGMRLSTVRVGL